MWTTKKLRDVAEKGVESVKKADNSLRLCIALAAVTLVVVVATFLAVLVTRPARA